MYRFEDLFDAPDRQTPFALLRPVEIHSKRLKRHVPKPHHAPIINNLSLLQVSKQRRELPLGELWQPHFRVEIRELAEV